MTTCDENNTEQSIIPIPSLDGRLLESGPNWVSSGGDSEGAVFAASIMTLHTIDNGKTYSLGYLNFGSPKFSCKADAKAVAPVFAKAVLTTMIAHIESHWESS